MLVPWRSSCLLAQVFDYALINCASECRRWIRESDSIDWFVAVFVKWSLAIVNREVQNHVPNKKMENVNRGCRTLQSSCVTLKCRCLEKLLPRSNRFLRRNLMKPGYNCMVLLEPEKFWMSCAQHLLLITWLCASQFRSGKLPSRGTTPLKVYPYRSTGSLCHLLL